MANSRVQKYQQCKHKGAVLNLNNGYQATEETIRRAENHSGLTQNEMWGIV